MHEKAEHPKPGEYGILIHAEDAPGAPANYPAADIIGNEVFVKDYLNKGDIFVDSHGVGALVLEQPEEPILRVKLVHHDPGLLLVPQKWVIKSRPDRDVDQERESIITNFQSLTQAHQR